MICECANCTPAPKATECCQHSEAFPPPPQAPKWECGCSKDFDDIGCEYHCGGYPKPPAPDKVESKRLEMMDRYLKWQRRGGITPEDAQFGYDLKQLIALVRAEKGDS